MNSLTWEMLESRSTEQTTVAQKQPLSVELLGKIIAWASCLYAPSEPVDADDIFSILTNRQSWQDMPASIAEAIHIDHQLDGDHIVEATQMMAAAQSSMALGRLNPDTIVPIYKITPLVAHCLLEDLENEHYEEISWVKKQIAAKYRSTKQTEN